MASNQLSDEELREELSTFGPKVGPITDSTRDIYMKRLHNLRAGHLNTAKKGQVNVQRPSRKLIGFSSDESDRETATGAVETRTRSKSRKLGKPISAAASVPRQANPSTSNLARVSIGKKTLHDVNNSTGSGNRYTRSRTVSSKTNSSTPWQNNHQNNTPAKDVEFDSSDSEGEGRKRTPERSNNASFSVNPRARTTTNLNQTFTRNSLPTNRRVQSELTPSPRSSTPLGEASSSTFSSSGHNSVDASPNLGLYKRRLEKLDAELQLQKEFKSDNPVQRSYMTYMSWVIVLLTAAFFLLLGMLYLSGVKQRIVLFGDPDTQKLQADNLLLCGKLSTLEGIAYENCYTEAEAQKALKYVDVLSKKLSQEAGDYRCKGDYTGTGSLTKETALDYLQDALGEKSFLETSDTLDIAMHLAAVNQHWGIRLKNRRGAPTDSMSSVTWLESVYPTMPLLCRIWRSIQLILNRVFLLLLDILKTHYDNCQTNKDLKPYLAIPHVRDMLIPHNQRQAANRVWLKAVSFLSENESRVRVEVQPIAGEDFTVWRWLPACGNSVGSSNSKVWQGSAFENQQKMVNYCPTPCLKIRNMFDKDIEHGSDWRVTVQDAILEKCADNHDIVHIAVDTSSVEGCVYMKCSSHAAAGKAYHALHGWWFDGKLVTVKYLRLERYHERFPDARCAVTPLQPSNDKRASLSVPFYKSTLEIT
ncbi:PREDICTED: inner nuclear membrane protein Man1-like isoform X2 [Priapulus caudatus]|uniref:Inner nuclear membrane protein Man1-like isoform X2 n=1 Tax=Priapulus caudatus TaxID=37621 RepID=A0ABM1EBH6_PRICU|nr:PREDICTED: inner nuclear membrane protein Man1-like isoform X2 [Priapulus caudatus]